MIRMRRENTMISNISFPAFFFSYFFEVFGDDYLSIYKIAQIISKLRNNIPIKIKNKNLKFTNSKPSKLKISSNKYKKEFRNKINISFKDGINRLIEWNLNKNEK